MAAAAERAPPPGLTCYLYLVVVCLLCYQTAITWSCYQEIQPCWVQVAQGLRTTANSASLAIPFNQPRPKSETGYGNRKQVALSWPQPGNPGTRHLTVLGPDFISWSYWKSIYYPLCGGIFLRQRKIYLHLLSFLNTERARAANILTWEKQGSMLPA